MTNVDYHSDRMSVRLNARAMRHMRTCDRQPMNSETQAAAQWGVASRIAHLVRTSTCFFGPTILCVAPRAESTSLIEVAGQATAATSCQVVGDGHPENQDHCANDEAEDRHDILPFPP